jgi:hypothetical protein
MCGNHDLIQTTTPDEAALIAARERAERADGLHGGPEGIELPAIASGFSLALPDVLSGVQIVRASRVEMAVAVTPPVAQPVVGGAKVEPVTTKIAKSTGATVRPARIETNDSIEDVLLAGFDAMTSAAKASVVARLAAVLHLPKGSDIAATRIELDRLLKAQKIKPTDLADWLKVESITPEITAALRVLSSRSRDTVKLNEVNNLRTALGLPPISAGSNWKNEACGPMLVGKLYEKLQEKRLCW